MSDSVWPHRRQPTRLPRPWGSPDKNTGVGCHFLLQCTTVTSESSPSGYSIHGIFQARVLEWRAIAFSMALTTVSEKITEYVFTKLRPIWPFSSSNKASLIKWKEWILGYSMNILIFKYDPKSLCILSWHDILNTKSATYYWMCDSRSSIKYLHIKYILN